MHAEGSPPGSGAGGSLPAGVLLALKPLLEMAAAERAGAASPVEVARITQRTERLVLLLLAFYGDMARGMHEFRRAYGIPSSAEEGGTPKEMARRLLAAGDDDAFAALDAGVQELKVHHAALLEAYNEATHRGAREILGLLDPDVVRREFRGGAVKVGPLRLPVSWRPVMVQAVWEEILQRLRRLRALETADYEKFFREGFREGYQRFRSARTRRADAPAEAAGEPPSEG